MSKDISQGRLLQLVQQAIYRTYYKELVKRTPGKGIVADGWDVYIEGDSVVIRNDEHDDIIGYLEYGTNPHKIKAKEGHYLAFKWPDAPIPPHKDDGTFFFKEVNHPGIKAYKFMQSVVNDKVLNKEFEQVFSDLLEREIKK